MILAQFAIVFLLSNCMTCSSGTYNVPEYHEFLFWPSVHSAIQKRQAVQTSGINEGGGAVQLNALPVVTTVPTPKPEDKMVYKTVSATSKAEAAPTTPSNKTPKEAIPSVVNKTVNESTSSDTKLSPAVLDLSNPGVAKRGAIVFGGFLLLAVAYYVFYRKIHTKTESNNPSTNDTNQFRYGVLQSDDRRDNMELSQIPLTMESDDEEDEDLEIFDLGHKKKSLSYINLQPNDEDLVFDNPRRELDKDNLLLDIEDSHGSETLINWSSNGSKSIL